MIDRVPELLAETRMAGLFEDIDFPISKDELIDLAEDHQAPDKVIYALDRLPNKVFYSIGEVYECWHEPKEGE